MLWAGGVPAEVACPAPTLETPLSLCQTLAGHPFSPEQGSLFPTAQGPRQAMALLAGSAGEAHGPFLLPGGEYLCLFLLPGAKLSGPFVLGEANVSGLLIYQLFPEKLSRIRPCSVGRIMV